jgi:gas vesicle protein GvpL/GvpF
VKDRTATYVYCIVHAAVAPKPSRAPQGLPGATRPSVLPAGRSLWIVVADVPLERYGPAPLEASLRDMQWVADVAVAHEAVVEHFSRQTKTAVIPMKLFTMFSTTERAVQETRSRRRDLDPVFKRIACCEEWGVRITRAVPALPRRKAGAERASSGAAFLAAKKQARDDAQEAVRAAGALAAGAFEALAAVARDARRRDDAPEGAAAPPLLDAAFLVPANRRARFRSLARRLAAGSAKAGAQMTLTGPWPAYNFVQTEPRQ